MMWTIKLQENKMLRTQSIKTNPLSTTIFVEDELCKQYLSEIWKKDLTLPISFAQGVKKGFFLLQVFIWGRDKVVGALLIATLIG